MVCAWLAVVRRDVDARTVGRVIVPVGCTRRWHMPRAWCDVNLCSDTWMCGRAYAAAPRCGGRRAWNVVVRAARICAAFGLTDALRHNCTAARLISSGEETKQKGKGSRRIKASHALTGEKGGVHLPCADKTAVRENYTTCICQTGLDNNAGGTRLRLGDLLKTDLSL